MTTPRVRRLGDLETRVMECLWRRPGGGTVREVMTDLADERALAYTTVMTVLTRLSGKGFVTREPEGRAWRYQAAQSRESLAGEAMRLSIDQVGTTGDRRAAMLHFLDGASAEELQELRTILEQLEPGDAGDHRRGQVSPSS